MSALNENALEAAPCVNRSSAISVRQCCLRRQRLERLKTLARLAISTIFLLLAWSTLAPPQGTGAALDPQPRLLTRISEIRALSLEEASKHYPIHLQAVVLAYNANLVALPPFHSRWRWVESTWKAPREWGNLQERTVSGVRRE